MLQNSSKVVLLIDTLNSGGAQRQIVNLAILLKIRSLQVSLIAYYPHDHFAPLLKSKGVDHYLIQSNNRIQRVVKIRAKLRELEPDVLISFLKIPSLISQILSFPRAPWKLIVSERGLYMGEGSISGRISRFLYRFTDAIITNSYSNQQQILEDAPWSKGKTHVIYNSVDFERFKPRSDQFNENNDIIVVSSFRTIKNPIGLIKALGIVINKRPDLQFIVRWFGHSNVLVGDDSSRVYNECLRLIEELNLSGRIEIREPKEDIEEEYVRSSCLLLTSFSEGLPNVVCEAMACGIPILMSEISDARRLVKSGVGGLLFDPLRHEDIADEIIDFLDTNVEVREQMGRVNRKNAEMLFSSQDFADNYLKVINKVLAIEKAQK